MWDTDDCEKIGAGLTDGRPHHGGVRNIAVVGPAIRAHRGINVPTDLDICRRMFAKKLVAAVLTKRASMNVEHLVHRMFIAAGLASHQAHETPPLGCCWISRRDFTEDISRRQTAKMSTIPPNEVHCQAGGMCLRGAEGILRPPVAGQIYRPP